ncbi:MAG: hypothetical protein WCH34_01455 [Bacteroidota bacterium]
MNIVRTITPRIPKRYLLFIAAVVWTFAGGMLLFKGITLLISNLEFIWIILPASIIGGSLFYMLLFAKISLKHTKRIINLKIEKPCLFSFFNIRSYVMMTLMITMGILLRRSGWVSTEYFSIIDITMGIPLFLSAFRFYYYGMFYRTILLKTA